jgi:arylsulfatase A-like enzyme
MHLSSLVTLLILAVGAAGAVPGCEPAPAGRFVVLVVMDTTRLDALGCYGREDGATPNIDAVAAEGVRFDRAISTSGWTLPSVASLLTATWPTIHGAVGRGTMLSTVRRELVTAAEAMKLAGYRTAAYANAAFVSPQLGIDRGFDVFDHVYAFNRSTRRADETVDAAVAFIREHRSDDCFILVHLFDPHLDYDPPGEYGTRFTGGRGRPAPPLTMEHCLALGEEGAEDVAYVRQVYQGEVAFMDAHIGRLISELRSAGAYERAVLVLTADHGEEFWDHGDFEHGHTLYDELVRVPLIVKFPYDLKPARREVSWQVRSIDVMPTVFDYLGVDVPDTFEGESMLPLVRGIPTGHREAFSESLLYGARRVSWRTSSFVYIQNIEEGVDDVGELYDWRADPAEQVDLSKKMPEIAAQLRSDCLDFYIELLGRARGMSVLETVDMSPQEVEKLRSLGYIR